MKQAKICATDKCGEPAWCAGLCKACYAGMYYWQRKGVAAMMKHRAKVQRINARMELMARAAVLDPFKEAKGPKEGEEPEDDEP